MLLSTWDKTSHCQAGPMQILSWQLASSACTSSHSPAWHCCVLYKQPLETVPPSQPAPLASCAAPSSSVLLLQLSQSMPYAVFSLPTFFSGKYQLYFLTQPRSPGELMAEPRLWARWELRFFDSHQLQQNSLMAQTNCAAAPNPSSTCASRDTSGSEEDYKGNVSHSAKAKLKIKRM